MSQTRTSGPDERENARGEAASVRRSNPVRDGLSRRVLVTTVGLGSAGAEATTAVGRVAVHAVRNLARMGFGVVNVRWSQLGFIRASSTTTSQTTERKTLSDKIESLSTTLSQGSATVLE